MVFSRRIVACLVVAVLAISLSSELLGGQTMRCAAMSSLMPSNHAQHATDATVASHEKQSDRAPQTSSCRLGTLCLNAPAILVSAPVSFDAPRVPVVIIFGATIPAAQSLRPESPPPKI